MSALAALALTLDLGAGISQGTPVADGFWYQSALPHTTRMTSPSWRAGITLGDSWKTALHYVDLGVSHMDALATTDANYDRIKHQCVHDCGHLDRFTGAGSANGVSLTEERRFGAFTIGLGAYLYQPYWVEVIDGTRYSNNPHAWHIGPSIGLGISLKRVEIRLDDYFTCISNRCKTERTPGPWGSIAALTINYRLKVSP